MELATNRDRGKLALWAAALFLSAAVTEVAAIEKPDFTLIEQHEEFEVRRYEPMIVARTLVDSAFKEAGNEGFRRLAAYIFGENARDQKIAMTAPVDQTPHADPASGGKYWIKFYMPAAFELGDLPDPLDPRVEIVVEPEKTVAVLPYRGGWSIRRYREHESRLLAALDEADTWERNGEVTWARYSPPFVPGFLKQNEVAVEVRAAKAEAEKAAIAAAKEES